MQEFRPSCRVQQGTTAAEFRAGTVTRRWRPAETTEGEGTRIAIGSETSSRH